MELGLGLGSRGSDKQVDSLDMPARDRLQCVQGPVLLVPVLVLRMLPTKIASVLKTKADVGQQKAMDDHVRIFFCNCNRSCSPPPSPKEPRDTDGPVAFGIPGGGGAGPICRGGTESQGCGGCRR